MSLLKISSKSILTSSSSSFLLSIFCSSFEGVCDWVWSPNDCRIASSICLCSSRAWSISSFSILKENQNYIRINVYLFLLRSSACLRSIAHIIRSMILSLFSLRFSPITSTGFFPNKISFSLSKIEKSCLSS